MSELFMIPCLNKIDVEFAKPDLVINQMKEIFAFDNEEIIKISAKTGFNVPLLLGMQSKYNWNNFIESFFF